MSNLFQKGSIINFTSDYDWKYGEPSIYSDEQLHYLVVEIDGEIMDEGEEHIALKIVGSQYHEMLKTVRKEGPQKFIVEEIKIKRLND